VGWGISNRTTDSACLSAGLGKYPKHGKKPKELVSSPVRWSGGPGTQAQGDSDHNRSAGGEGNEHESTTLLTPCTNSVTVFNVPSIGRLI